MLIPARGFVYAAMVAWGGIGTAVLTELREPDATVETQGVVEQAKFDERWDWAELASADDPLPAKKSDRIKSVVVVPVVKVPVEAVQSEHGMEALEAKTQTKGQTVKSETKPEAHKRTVDERDVCQRHHMHKVWIRHGRSWRCRK